MDGFRVTPFWKQWNALIQFNIEKNKYKPGVYVVPESFLYHHQHPYSYGGYGFRYPLYSPYGNNFSPFHASNSLLMDDLKPPAPLAMVQNTFIIFF